MTVPPREAAPAASGSRRAWTRRARSWLIDEQWTIGVLDRPIDSLLDRPSVADARWLVPPPGGYLADPFGLPGGDRILAEWLDFGTMTGRLVALHPDRPAALEPVALGTDRHLSYPFVFDWDGAVWMVPESAADRVVRLYRLRHGVWEAVADLLSGVGAADATLFPWDGRWWMAYADNDRGPHDTLLLCYAPTPLGPWRPHPGNPVRLDAAGARPAGTPFVRDGVLYRPGQDCSLRYGGATVIHRVDCLTPTRFAETAVVRIEPERGGRFPVGLHTLAAWGERTLLDASREGFQPRAFARRVRSRLGGLAPHGQGPAGTATDEVSP